MKERLLISACLLGVNCKYNGLNNKAQNIELLKLKYDLYPVCPEVDGGLSIPRVPCEIIKDKVINKNGEDKTLNYQKGANHALEICKSNNITKALLKEKSPSCGSHLIYDGNFNGTTIKGQGITAQLLTKNGIEVFSEDDIFKLL